MSAEIDSNGYRGQSIGGPQSPGSQTKYNVKNQLRNINNDIDSDLD